MSRTGERMDMLRGFRTYGPASWEGKCPEAAVRLGYRGTLVVHKDLAVRDTGSNPYPLDIFNVIFPFLYKATDILHQVSICNK